MKRILILFIAVISLLEIGFSQETIYKRNKRSGFWDLVIDLASIDTLTADTINANRLKADIFTPKDSVSPTICQPNNSSSLLFSNGTPNLASINVYHDVTYKGVDLSAGNKYVNGAWEYTVQGKPAICLFENLQDSTIEFWFEPSGNLGDPVNWTTRKAWIDSEGGGHFNSLTADSYDMGIMYLPTNAGEFGKIIDMDVTSASPDNTVHSYYFGINNDSLLMLRALSNGIGGIDNRSVWVRGVLVPQAENNNGTSFCALMRNSSGTDIFKFSDHGTQLIYAGTTATLRFQNPTTGTGSGEGTQIAVYNSDVNFSNREDGIVKMGTNAIDRNYIAKPKTLTDGVTTNFADIALTDGGYSGGQIIWTIFVIDASGDAQSCSGTATYAAINDGGVYTTSIIQTETQALDAGTCVNTFSITTGTNEIALNVNSNSSLTPATHLINYTIINNSTGNITGK